MENDRNLSNRKAPNRMENITQIILDRFSCRTYNEKPLSTENRSLLELYVQNLNLGPFGSKAKFYLVAATEVDNSSLQELGTYGFIQGATAYVIGTISPEGKNLEDYGFLMEKIILYATSLGLGTCWLGGSFTRSTFSQKIKAELGEIIPAVTPIGNYIDLKQAREGLLRKRINADQRLSWDKLFFIDTFGSPLTKQQAGKWETALEMVRRGPSASNKQPWRIVQKDGNFHFYLQRTKGYREGIIIRFLGVQDIQRLDSGIAMCHFELTAREQNLPGQWIDLDPKIEMPDDLTEYVVSWIAK